MRTFVGVVFLLYVIALFVVSGCSGSPLPPPKIEVEGHDTTEWSGITVKYYNHTPAHKGDPPMVTLNTPEQIAAYKKQVVFLLKALEDAERKMAIRNDKPDE